MLLRQVRTRPTAPAYLYPDPSETWQTLTWADTWERVEPLAAGLIALGVNPQDRVGIAADCRLEWVLADHAVMCAGGATTTVYPSTAADDVSYILSDSGCRVVFAEDATQVGKVLAHLDQLPELLTIVLMDAAAGQGAEHDKVITWQQLLERGRELLASDADVVTRTIDGVGPDDLATLIYTSGTTGRPKGVRLVHDNWLYEGAAVAELELLSADDLQYLWLPLSHVFGKCLIAIQLEIGFATAVDGRIDKIVEGLGAVQPTFMAGAPRIFEKVRAKVTMTASHGIKSKIFAWAFGVGRKVSVARLAGGEPSGLLAVQNAIATKLVFSKLTARMGGRIRFFVSGSAALSREVQEWFHAAGLLILEGYGLTESSAFSFVNLPEAPVFGTVGPPAPGTEVRIADDGEILLRGRGIMHGYHHREEDTAAALDADGWLHTGDIGEVTDGRLRITDRKKDLIKTSGGKYVAPQKVESIMKGTCPYVAQVIVHGEGRKFISALFELDPDAIGEWAEANGLAGKDLATLATEPAVVALINDYVEQTNAKLERWETIKKFAIIPASLTVEAGEITPSMKLRRKVAEKHYEGLLDGLYPPD